MVKESFLNLQFSLELKEAEVVRFVPLPIKESGCSARSLLEWDCRESRILLVYIEEVEDRDMRGMFGFPLAEGLVFIRHSVSIH